MNSVMNNIGSYPMEVSRKASTGRWKSGLTVSVQVVAAIVFACATLQPTHAAMFTCPAPPDPVTGALIGDVQCLIDAINTANTNGEADTIILEVGTYTLQAPATAPGLNATGLPPVTSRITIQGTTLTGPPPPNAPPATGNGTVITRNVNLGFGSIFRVLEVVAPGGNLTLQNVIIRGGLAQFGGGIRNRATLELINSEVSSNIGTVGGGMHNAGVLTLRKSAIRANRAQNLLPGGGFAGGIFNTNTGTVELNSSSIGDTSSLANGNLADFSGGGLLNDRGLVILTSSSFGFNGAQSLGGFGGGLWNIGGIVELTKSGFAQNVGFNGGAIANTSSGQVRVCTCPFNANVGFQGGGIHNNSGGRVTFGCPGSMDFSFFIGNRAVNPATGQPGQGGAIWNGSGTVTRGPFTSFMNNTPNNCTGVVTPPCPAP